MSEAVREMTFEEEYKILHEEMDKLFANEDTSSDCSFEMGVIRRAYRCILKLQKEHKRQVDEVLERLEEEKSDWNNDYNIPINKAQEIVKEVMGCEMSI